MFLTAQEMYACEEALFATGVTAEELMNSAGQKIADEILRRFGTQQNARAVAVIGKGNNGADALVALRHLKEAGWQVTTRSADDPSHAKGLLRKKWADLPGVPLLKSLDDLEANGPLIILDGLLGIGTSGHLREPLAGIAKEINNISHTRHAFVVSVDLPSGLNCDTGEAGATTVHADLTCTLGSPKPGLIADTATPYVGSISLLSLPGLSDWNLENDQLICPATLPHPLLKRPYDFHKGQAGRVGIIAGSQGLAGAAALASLGALRGGAGLITLFVKQADYPLISPLVPVEVMVKPMENFREILQENLDALAIGPGLGNAGHDILSLINAFEGPTVIDADALNLVAQRGSISSLRANHLVTPHPGEMKRLLPSANEDNTRAQIARSFTKSSQATLLFKGSRTIVTNRESPLYYNTTGTPAMATGGQGDVLSGVIAALLARGISPIDAAKMGAWLSGRASELALTDDSLESLSATTTATHLGASFQSLRHFEG